MIQTIHIGVIKARFSEVAELVKNGNTIKVVNGKSKELVGFFGLEYKSEKPKKRQLGFFSNYGVVINKKDLEW